MPHARQTEPSGQSEDMALSSLGVVLVVNKSDPSILNRDFLLRHEIIDEKLQLASPPMSTPLFSHLEFEGDIVITARSNQYIFEQKRNPPNINAYIIPTIAKNFVKAISYLRYDAVGINPNSFKSTSGANGHKIKNLLLDKGKWISFKDVDPDIGLRAAYNYGGKRIILNIGNATFEAINGKPELGILFHANIHRNIQEGDQYKCIEKVLSILDSWKEDIYDFMEIIGKINSKGDATP